VALLLADTQLPPGWELVGSSGMARVACHREDGIFYKEFMPRSPAGKVKAVIRGSWATRTRLHSEELLKSGFEAPHNIAWGKLSGGREYLFTEAVPGASITDWLRRKLTTRDAPALQLRRQLLRELGIFIGRLHYTGFIHGDLRPGNVLAQHEHDRFGFFLIDNERNLQQKPPPGKMLLKNLMQLNMLLPADLTRTDRMRFFKAWHSQMRDLSKTEARLLARESFQWAYRRLGVEDKL
jgi:serine/threonine protein kinase